MLQADNVKVLAFDAGMQVTGYAVIERKNGTYVVSRFGSIKASAQVSRVLYKDRVEEFGKSTIALSYLNEQIEILMNEIRPDFVVVEDAYLNPRIPQAYQSLIQWICAVKIMLYKTFGKALHRLPTKIAKRAAFGSGSAEKENVMDAILTREDIDFKQKKQSVQISEHEADAIAVGIGFLSESHGSM